jgi:hypothetical protein
MVQVLIYLVIEKLETMKIKVLSVNVSKKKKNCKETS